MKPSEADQTLSPAALMMAPLSTWPLPTRLCAVGQYLVIRCVCERACTSCQHKLLGNVSKLALVAVMLRWGVARGLLTLPGHGDVCESGGQVKDRRSAADGGALWLGLVVLDRRDQMSARGWQSWELLSLLLNGWVVGSGLPLS